VDQLSQEEAAEAYATAWNRLDATAFLGLLAETARYASQWVIEDLENRAAISDYLVQKLETIRESGVQVHAELGATTLGGPARPCVCMFQGDKLEMKAVVLFEVGSGQVQRLDICIPGLYEPRRTGVYPT